MNRGIGRVLTVLLLTTAGVNATGQTTLVSGTETMLLVSDPSDQARLLVWDSDRPGLVAISLAGLSLAQQDIATAQPVRELAAGDVNGDGLMDLVVSLGQQNEFGLVLGETDGYSEVLPVAWNSNGARIVGLADTNADGRDDLVLQRDAGGTRYWDVALSSGDTLRGPVAWTSTRSANVNAFAVEDANGDGRADLWLWFDSSNGRSYQMRLSDGTEFSGIVEWLRSDRNGLPFSTADADGDGRPDLWIQANSGRTRTWSVYRNTGSAFSRSAVSTNTTTPNVEAVAAADATGDGRADLWLEYDNRGSRNWQIRQFSGSGFDPIANWHAAPSSADIRAIGLADANGDGRADLWLRDPRASGSEQPVARTLFSTGSGFSATAARELAVQPPAVAAAPPQTDPPAGPGPATDPPPSTSPGPATQPADQDETRDPVTEATEPPVGPSRAATPQPITLQFGNWGLVGTIEPTDGGYEGFFADAYELEAEAGASYTITASFPVTLPFRLHVFAPDGKRLESSTSNPRMYQFQAPSDGTYRLFLFSSDPTVSSQYGIRVGGPGTEFAGEVEIGRDRTDMGVTYDSVDLTLPWGGFYQFVLFEELRDGAMFLRDANYNDIVGLQKMTDTGRSLLTGDIEAGEYHVIIEDKAFGGPWRLIVTYVGGGS